MIDWRKALRKDGYNVALVIDDPKGILAKKKLPWIYRYPQFCGSITLALGEEISPIVIPQDGIYILAANVILHGTKLDNGVVSFMVSVRALPGTLPKQQSTFITKIMITEPELDSKKINILRTSIERIIGRYIRDILRGS